MKKLLFIAVVMSSFGIANCVNEQLLSQKSGDAESSIHDENYRNLPVQIATHLANVDEQREMGDVEQLLSFAKNHFMLTHALCEVPNLPRPQLFYMMLCAEFSIVRAANLWSMCVAPDIALTSIYMIDWASIEMGPLMNKTSDSLRKKVACGIVVDVQKKIDNGWYRKKLSRRI